MIEEKEFDKQLIEEKENSTNTVTALVMILFSLCELVIVFIFAFNSEKFSNFTFYPILIVAGIAIIPSIYFFVSKKKNNWLKYVLAPILLLSITILDFYFSYFSTMLFALPIILVASYNSKKYTLIMSGAGIVCLLLSTLFCYLATHYYGFICFYAYMNSETLLSEALINNFFIKVLFYIIVAVTAYFISFAGMLDLKKIISSNNRVTSLKSELDTASKIQNSILPEDNNLALHKGFHLYATMKPAKEVAGDFYDYFYIKDKLAFLVGDVSDKGLSAAMFMMNVKNTIKAIAMNSENVADILTNANKIISSNNKEMMFVTIWMGLLDLNTGECECVNAGHCPAFIKGKNGEIRKLESEPQLFIGVDEKIVYKSFKFDLNKGENILIYTDGVTDSLNKNDIAFGEDNLINSIKRNNYFPKNLINGILDDIYAHAKDVNQFDDITLVSIYNNGLLSNKKFKYETKSLSEIINDVDDILNEYTCNETKKELIESALDDAIDNIIEYAKSDSEFFEVNLQVTEGIFTISIIDDGKEFNPLKCKDPELSGDREIGGLGIYLYKNIMDETNYLRLDNKNILTLSKKIN